MTSPDSSDQRLYVVAHVDVVPQHTQAAIQSIQAYVEATRREPGAVRVEAVQEVRANHFNVLEVWRDRAAFEAHSASPAAIAFHDEIFPWRGSPFEERLGISIAP